MMLDKTTVLFMLNEISDLINRRMKAGKRKHRQSSDDLIAAVGRFIADTASTKNQNENDLVVRCREILAWKTTGILEGNVLRTKARTLQEKFPITMGEALSMAETQTFEECMKLIIERFSRTTVQYLPGTVVPSKKDGFWTYTLRAEGGEILAEDAMLFDNLFSTAAEAKQAMREKCGIKVGQ